MKIAWIKGKDSIRFDTPITFLILGTRGCGKSTLIETAGEFYLQRGHKVLDLFGSRDGEGLAWLRSEWAKDRRMLLICGDNSSVDSSWDSKPVSKLRLQDFEDYDILISSSPLYSDPDTEFLSVAGLTDLLYNRLSWRKIIFCLVREASNLYYSRLKVTRNQQLAKSQEIYLLRECRHMGVSMGMDSLKFTSVDLDVRAVSDFLIFKSLGLLGLPKDMEWVYRYINPPYLRSMDKGEFVIVSKSSALGYGVYSPLHWHKREKENLVKKLGLKIEHGTPQRLGVQAGKRHDVSDSEHQQIIEAYDSRRSMGVIAREIRRSQATITGHIHIHDNEVKTFGACSRCSRMKAACATKMMLQAS